MYIDVDYFGSYHDVIILQHLNIYQNWYHYFIYGNNYFVYLTSNPRYMGEDIFIIHKIGLWKLAPNLGHDVVWIFNKMHVGIKV